MGVITTARRTRWPTALLLCASCARAPAPEPSPTPPRAAPPAPAPPVGAVEVPGATPHRTPTPAIPPRYAYAAGMMPLSSTGIDRFRVRHPTYDGRGVLIGILDSGVDPGVAGLLTTSTGASKVLDLRDFSDEGRVLLAPAAPGADGMVRIGAAIYRGAGRIARIATASTWYVGTLRERSLGLMPAADLNGDGTNTDLFGVVVVKATDGWVAFIDANGDGSFEDDAPVHDYRAGRETVALGSKPFTLAVNIQESGGVPRVDYVFDNSGHGTHVAGIAAGHDLFAVPGFDGVAPGAQILGLKVAGRGGVAVTGSVERALAYATQYAESRGLRLVLNLSVGAGNEDSSRAVIDSVIDAFLGSHPDVVLAASAGNDGPGLSSAGFPGSADLVLATGASVPAVFALPPPPGTRARDIMAWWSARGGALAKPDVIAPGVAFSTVPAFDTGDEIKGGTSMAAPQVAGLAACLLSGMAQENRTVRAADVAQALRASARPLPDASVLDQGAGQPQAEVAYRWLEAGHQGSQYRVRSAQGTAAAFFRTGLGPDSVELFQVRHLAGLRAAALLLRSDRAWLTAPAMVSTAAGETTIPVRYRAAELRAPGAYTGTVTAWNATDTLAGPVFRLINTIIVPHDLESGALEEPARVIAPASVARYFLLVPRPGLTLVTTVALADSLQRATVCLYEPGRPGRAADNASIGIPNAGTVRIVVPGEDLLAGVYELDVLAPPQGATSVRVRAELSALALNPLDGALEVSNAGSRTVTGRLSEVLLGAERSFDVRGNSAAPETLRVDVPTWATAAIVDVAVPALEWGSLIGFGVTELDSTGQELAQHPLTYAVGRQHLPLAEGLRGHPLQIELAPAFAHPAGDGWQTQVRIQFLLAHPVPAGTTPDVSAVGGGRVAVPLPATAPLALPPGFEVLVLASFHPTSGPGLDAERRVARASIP